MTSPNEIPRLPADDLIGSNQLTVARLSREFDGFANRDKRFLEHQRYETGLSPSWHSSDGTDLSISFNAEHHYQEGVFQGNDFTLGFKLARTIHEISEDFVKAAAQLEAELPDEDILVSVSFTHVAEFIVMHNVALSWSTYQQYIATEYLGCNDDGPVYGAKMYYLQTELKKDPKVGVGQKVDYTDVDKELEDCIETEVHLRQAHEVFVMFQEGDEGDFDLSTVFPPAFLKSKDDKVS